MDTSLIEGRCMHTHTQTCKCPWYYHFVSVENLEISPKAYKRRKTLMNSREAMFTQNLIFLIIFETCIALICSHELLKEYIYIYVRKIIHSQWGTLENTGKLQLPCKSTTATFLGKRLDRVCSVHKIWFGFVFLYPERNR